MAKLYNQKTVSVNQASAGQVGATSYAYKGFSSANSVDNFKLYDIDLVKQDIINYDPRIQVNAVGVDSTEQGIRIEADVTYIPFNVSERMKFNFDRDNSVIN